MADYGFGGFGNDNDMGGAGGLSLGGSPNGGLSHSGNFGDGYGLSDTQGPGQGFRGPSDSGGTDSGYDFGYNPSFPTQNYESPASYDLGGMFTRSSTGFQPEGGVGLRAPSNGSSTGLGLGGDSASETGFFDSPLGRFLKQAGLFAANMTPAGRLATTAYGIGKALSEKQYGSAVGGLVGAASGNGLIGAGAGLATDAALGKDVSTPAARTLGSAVGGFIGNTVAGPFGGMVGSSIGSAAATGTGATGPSNAPKGDGKSLSSEELASSLGNMWLRYQGSKDAARASSGANVDSQLNDMFGPNSAYATQLRQELARKDAASGRRSQYGAREVELQARLATMKANALPGMVSAYSGQSRQQMEANQAKRIQQAQLLSSLYALGKDTKAFDQLDKMFMSPSPTTSYSLPSSGSYLGLQPPTTSSGNQYSLF